MRAVGRQQLRGGRFARQQVEVQRQFHQHALVEIAHRRHEDRPARDAAVFHDLGNVLVLQAERVQLIGRRVARFVGLDHLAPAARVAADRRQHGGVVRRQQPGIDQRPQQRDGAGGVAAGVGHALGLLHGGALVFRQLGEAESPAFGHAVRRAGVDDARLLARQRVDHGHRFACRVVVQAQDDQIDTGHDLALGVGVLAFGRVDADEIDARHVRQPLANLQPGGAGFAVDENLGHCVLSFAWRRVMAT